MDSQRKEQLTSLFLMIFSLGVCVMTFQLGLGTLRIPGSGFFPFWGGVVLGLLSLTHFLVATIQRRRAAKEVESQGEDINWKNLLVTFSLLSSYPFMLGVIGFLPSTFCFFFLLLRFIEPQKWSIVFGLSAATAVLAFFIFQYWLRMQFPIGIFGI
jgi:hypothetical protein